MKASSSTRTRRSLAPGSAVKATPMAAAAAEALAGQPATPSKMEFILDGVIHGKRVNLARAVAAKHPNEDAAFLRKFLMEEYDFTTRQASDNVRKIFNTNKGAGVSPPAAGAAGASGAKTRRATRHSSSPESTSADRPKSPGGPSDPLEERANASPAVKPPQFDDPLATAPAAAATGSEVGKQFVTQPCKCCIGSLPEKASAGEDENGDHKLTKVQVEEVTDKRKRFGLSCPALATLYGVSHATIGAVFANEPLDTKGARYGPNGLAELTKKGDWGYTHHVKVEKGVSKWMYTSAEQIIKAFAEGQPFNLQEASKRAAKLKRKALADNEFGDFLAKFGIPNSMFGIQEDLTNETDAVKADANNKEKDAEDQPMDQDTTGSTAAPNGSDVTSENTVVVQVEMQDNIKEEKGEEQATNNGVDVSANDIAKPNGDKDKEAANAAEDEKEEEMTDAMKEGGEDNLDKVLEKEQRDEEVEGQVDQETAAALEVTMANDATVKDEVNDAMDNGSSSQAFHGATTIDNAENKVVATVVCDPVADPAEDDEPAYRVTDAIQNMTTEDDDNDDDVEEEEEEEEVMEVNSSPVSDEPLVVSHVNHSVNVAVVYDDEDEDVDDEEMEQQEEDEEEGEEEEEEPKKDNDANNGEELICLDSPSNDQAKNDQKTAPAAAVATVNQETAVQHFPTPEYYQAAYKPPSNKKTNFASINNKGSDFEDDDDLTNRRRRCRPRSKPAMTSSALTKNLRIPANVYLEKKGCVIQVDNLIFAPEGVIATRSEQREVVYYHQRAKIGKWEGQDDVSGGGGACSCRKVSRQFSCGI